MRRELPDKGGRGDKHERFNRFHLDRRMCKLSSILDLEQCRRTACRSTGTDRSSVHSQTVACMEKLLIKGKKNETNKKESKWFVQDPDEHTENITAGMAAGRTYCIW